MPDSMLKSLNRERVGDTWLSGTDIAALESAYVKRLKKRQVKAALLGVVVASVISFFLFFMGRLLNGAEAGRIVFLDTTGSR